MDLPHLLLSKGGSYSSPVTIGLIPTRGEGRCLCACEVRLVMIVSVKTVQPGRKIFRLMV